VVIANEGGHGSSLTQQEFIQTYEAHKLPVYRFVWRMSGSAEAAEDVAQDCFLTLWRSPQVYDAGRAPMRSFLFGVARNLCLKRMRTDGRFAPLSRDGDDEQHWVPPEGLRLVEKMSASEAVAAAVRELPALQREALILAEYEDMKIEEIARLTGAEVTAVKARLHRARENLRRMLTALNVRRAL
jgi:RNA polymerase sigma-70 factor, ECF subfamily